MSDLLSLRLHRFDALHALLVGNVRKNIADHFIENAHLRRDIGLPEAPTKPRSSGFSLPMVGLRR